MSGLASRLPRWRRRPTVEEPASGSGLPAPDGPRTVVEELGPDTGAGGAGGFLLRSSADRRTSVRDLARRLPLDGDRPVIVVDVAGDAAHNLGEALGGLLARLRAEHRPATRLVMSGAAAPKPDGLAPLAQRLADAWDLEIEAPDAAAVLVPGGGLYVCAPTTPAGGWWRFAPGTEPVALGARVPAPHWQRALARVPLGDLGACAVHQIPAGLLLTRAGAAVPGPGHAAFALAVHPERLTVLVAGAGARPDIAEDLATLLARLPARLRDRVRLAPAGGEDLLPVAQRTADLLGTEVEVCTGVPLPAPAASSGAHEEQIRLNAADGTSAWPALLTSVRCVPAEPDAPGRAPRPVHWLLPDTVGEPDARPAVRRLGEGRYVVAVRAGLWVGSTPTAPAAVLERAAEARAARIDVGDAGTDDGERNALLDALSALLPGLDEQVREHAEVSAPAGADRDTVNALRRFAIRHGLAFAGAPAEAAPLPRSEAPEPDASAQEPATGPAPEVGPAPETATTSEATPVPSPAPATEPRPTPPPGTAPTTQAPGTTPAPSPTPTTEPGTAPATTAPAPAPGQPAPTVVPPPARAARPATSSRPSTESALGVPPEADPGAPVEGAEARAAAAGPAPVPRAAPRPPRRGASASATGFSSGADRAAFRELAAAVWADCTGPVNRTMVRLPALRGPEEEQARVDLVAVQLYLASPPDGRFGALALAAEAGGEGGELAPYAACLASGLRRLPALRGTLMRAVPGPGIPDEAVVGAVLRCDAPLDVVHVEQKGAPSPPPEQVRYVIRPMTARRTSMLAAPGAPAVTALFAAGTEFTVLARHEAAGERPARVLLAEVPEGATQFRSPPPEVVARLDEAAGLIEGSSGSGWPARCTGPFPRRV
ncbi:hypothetical protein [Streptomyces sp. NPDC019224]|uniref:hypothetical protein n=1 Tax=Streptomyces sp. NPDC019224 TaxID=3154484 RepID=UPI0033E368AA